MFVEPSDFAASVHADILNQLTQSDSSVVPICVDRAVDEMTAYLSSRYDTRLIFSATGSDRLSLVLMFAVDIALYHIYTIGNPAKLSALRKDRYDRAVEWLKAVQKGNINLPGAPLLPDTDPARDTRLSIGSNPKRCHHF
jgi:phage gp36-like protein